MSNGSEDDEGFWEFGLHFFLVALIAVPVGLLVDYLMRFEYFRGFIPVLIGASVGTWLGRWIFHRLRRRSRKTPAEVEPSESIPDGATAMKT